LPGPALDRLLEQARALDMDEVRRQIESEDRERGGQA
jgi:hypothetical protein